MNGLGTFIPSTPITPGVITPIDAVGIHDDRNAFVKTSEWSNVTKWTQTVNGIPVSGTILTTHRNYQGMSLTCIHVQQNKTIK